MNSESEHKTDMGKAVRAMLSGRGYIAQPDEPIPLRHIPVSELEREGEPVLYRLGHSTILIRLDNKLVLTDPVFSKRASPVQWVGPARFHPVPLNVDDLPSLDVVVISHDHYDHLDKGSIAQLAKRTELFLTPLGVGDHLRRWGVDPDKIVELDWWQSHTLGTVELVATPSQHFSGRGLTDRNRTLWASWVIAGQGSRLFFTGDSGYFSGFAEIGERYGPFDVTLVEAGAYNPAWAAVHMLPAQSVQAHQDLRGAAMLPIHNGTFNLSTHDWFEPFEEISRLARRRGINLLTPKFGEPVSLREPVAAEQWWRALMPTPAGTIAAE